MSDNVEALPMSVPGWWDEDVADQLAAERGQSSMYVSKRMKARALIESGIPRPPYDPSLAPHPDTMSPLTMRCIVEAAKDGSAACKAYLAYYFPQTAQSAT